MQGRLAPHPCLRTPVQKVPKAWLACRQDTLSLLEMNFCRVPWQMQLLVMEHIWLTKEKNMLKNMYVSEQQLQECENVTFVIDPIQIKLNFVALVLLRRKSLCTGILKEKIIYLLRDSQPPPAMYSYLSEIYQAIIIAIHRILQPSEQRREKPKLQPGFLFSFQIDRFVSVSKLKYYFAVDTSYVVKKLGLLIFPYTHKVCVVIIIFFGIYGAS